MWTWTGRLLLVLNLVLCLGLKNEAPRIAVIGAGLGGCSSAYFLREDLGEGIKIDVYEKAIVGGRTTVRNVDGRVIEMGGSIVHNQNVYFKTLAEKLGLTLTSPGAGNIQTVFSIYDGQNFVFQESTWTVVTLARMIWRYGVSYFSFQKSPTEMLAKFLRIYKLQEAGKAYAVPEDMLEELQLYNATQLSMRAHLKDLLGKGKPAQRFGKELVAAVNHVNYNQNNSLNAFAGLVSLLPTVDSKLFAVKGGNYQLAEKLIQAANITLLTKEVIKVERRGTLFYLHTKELAVGPYAAVIIAAPLEESNIRFEGLQLPVLPFRAYQTTVTSIIQGRLKGSYFGGTDVLAGEYILVAEGSKTPFSVISPVTQYKSGLRLYKVFTKEPISRQLAQALFHNAHVVAEHAWKAYPRFNPPEAFAPFELAPGLFYNNALENAASAMEIAIIEGKNSALLTEQYLKIGRHASPSSHAESLSSEL